LIISKRLVELMQGEIGFVSGGGEGSTFWFTARFGRKPETSPVASPAPGLQQLRILAVDDNPTSCRLLEELLTAAGARVETVPRVQPALARLAEAAATGDPFQIVLLDERLAERDGKHGERAIPRSQAWGDPRLVLMRTGGAINHSPHPADADGYLVKPIKRGVLYTTLEKVARGELPVELPAEPERQPAAPNRVAAPRSNAPHILLAEDNIVNQKVATRILEKLGFQVDAVGNGADAIRALETETYDLVLMDVQMPVLDGFATTQQIRGGYTSVADPTLPILAMTAHAMKGDRERCLEAGMDDYIAKPIQAQELVAKLEYWLTQRHGASPEPSAETPLTMTSPPLQDGDQT
jgi:CheY-like chemotaxis protein